MNTIAKKKEEVNEKECLLCEKPGIDIFESETGMEFYVCRNHHVRLLKESAMRSAITSCNKHI